MQQPSVIITFYTIVIFFIASKSCAMLCLAEVEGLKRKLTSKLGGNSAGIVPDWKVLFWFPLYSF